MSKLGLVKMDFLGLNTLSIIHEALTNVKKNYGKDIDIKNIDWEDPEILKEWPRVIRLASFSLKDLG